MTIKNFLIFLLIFGGLNLQAADVKWKVFREYDLKTKKVGDNLKKVIDKKIKVVGFMIPLDYSAKEIKEFLLVPYYPSCAHVPPPPANQIIKVTMKGKGKIKVNYAPIEVEGTLKLLKKKSKKEDPYGMNGVFTMDGNSVAKFDISKKK